MARAPLFVALLVAMSAASPAIGAETVSFENSTALLAESCSKDITDNCLGVSLDAPRLRECLSRNADSISPQCRTDYIKAFDAIQKRIAARGAVGKACMRDKQKHCADTPGKPGETIACLLKAPIKGLTWVCNQALGQAGYR